MNLIGPLAAGLADCANGTAKIVYHGTGSFAEVFSTFEGDGAQTLSAAVTLDASGRYVCYVDSMVDVFVYDISGTLKATIVPGAKDAAVEVISKSFTGVDYKTGATGASEPTNLQTVLDEWKDSAGATDWKVMYRGAATDIKTAIASADLYFNVKAYGATGDGVTDDSVAIAAALTAAGTSGGTVFFPNGTYRCVTGQTVADKVSLLGAGAAVSIVKIDHASANLFTMSSTGAHGFQSVRSLSALPAQIHSGSLFYFSAAANVHFDDCRTGDSAYTFYGINAASGTVLVDSSVFLWGPTGFGAINASYARVIVSGSRFVASSGGGYGINTMSAGTHIDACTFSNTAGTPVCISCGLNSSVTGCDFSNGAPTAYAIASITNGGGLTEAGNTFSSTGVVRYSWTPTASTALNRAIPVLGTRDVSREYISSDASATAHSQYNRATTVARATTAAGATISVETPLAPGQSYSLFIYNGSGNPLTSATVSGITGVTGPSNLSSTSTFICECVSADINGTLVWLPVSIPTAV